MKIKQIDAQDTYALRQKVLRPNQSIESCQYDGDDQEDALHLGVFDEGSLISIATFYKESNPLLQKDTQYRLRGMATIAEYRNKQIGSALIQHAEALLKDRGISSWWCNARKPAWSFYEKHGLVGLTDEFTIPDIGPHKVMYKEL